MVDDKWSLISIRRSLVRWLVCARPMHESMELQCTWNGEIPEMLPLSMLVRLICIENTKIGKYFYLYKKEILNPCVDMCYIVWVKHKLYRRISQICFSFGLISFSLCRNPHWNGGREPSHLQACTHGWYVVSFDVKYSFVIIVVLGQIWSNIYLDTHAYLVKYRNLFWTPPNIEWRWFIGQMSMWRMSMYNVHSHWKSHSSRPWVSGSDANYLHGQHVVEWSVSSIFRDWFSYGSCPEFSS